MQKLIFNKSKIIGYLLLSSLAATSFNSCTKNNLTVDVSPVVAPDAVAFIPTTAVNRVSYYVKSTNDPFMIPVGITNVSSVDRTFNLTYTSNKAAAGTQYNAPATVTIKAGAAVDSILFKGLFSGYPTGRKDTVKVKFSGVNTVNLKDSFELIMQGYCDVIATNLTGNYASSTDTYGGSASGKPNYVANISSWTPLSATSSTIIIKNMGATPDNGWGPFSPTDGSLNPGILATLDWSNPANFSVTIAKQNYFNDGSGNSTITATGSFSSCDNTFTITCKVTYAGNGVTYTHISYLRR